MPDGATQLPWGQAPHVVGELAGRLGAKVPHRLVASAKSWICHGGINRRAPVLPWNAPDGEPQISPYSASVQYLAHLKAIWDAEQPNAPLKEQDVTITVPASFDEAARELTLDAAKEAGYGKGVRLIEEPQAAFYDYLGAQGDAIHEQLAGAKLVLVVDVGGGTTDLTFLKVLKATMVHPSWSASRWVVTCSGWRQYGRSPCSPCPVESQATKPRPERVVGPGAVGAPRERDLAG